jgi:hypothetical protein
MRSPSTGTLQIIEEDKLCILTVTLVGYHTLRESSLADNINMRMHIFMHILQGNALCSHSIIERSVEVEDDEDLPHLLRSRHEDISLSLVSQLHRSLQP